MILFDVEVEFIIYYFLDIRKLEIRYIYYIMKVKQM